jgi:hypothetical protein
VINSLRNGTGNFPGTTGKDFAETGLEIPGGIAAFRAMAKRPIAATDRSVQEPLPQKQIVEQHELAQMLRALGATPKDLVALHFSKFDPKLPFDMWAIVGPAWLVAKHHGPSKAFCAYRWLMMDDPPHSENTQKAWAYITHILEADLVQLGLRTKESQKKRAIRPRVRVGDYNEPLRGIIETLISKRDHKDLSARELWPLFQATLDNSGADPKEAISESGSPACSYNTGDGRRRISFRSFANLVSKLRRKSR